MNFLFGRDMFFLAEREKSCCMIFGRMAAKKIHGTLILADILGETRKKHGTLAEARAGTPGSKLGF